jgi:hypothetical protein
MAKDKKDFLASVAELFGQAVESARHEVAERGWFGRQVTDAPRQMHEQMPTTPVKTAGESWRPQSFEEQWAVRENMAPGGAEHDRDHGQDIDR